ncbi:MAG: YgfZ/GcvT domain-containing protein [Maritimibacter sp.]
MINAPLGETHENRTILRLTGRDRESFLQGLVTNNVSGISGLVYAALLTPQGKYLADFFVVPQGESLLVDVATSLAPMLLQKLNMYKLRADVALEATELYAIRGLGAAPEGAFPDPRDPALGWRMYRETAGGPRTVDWDAIRVAQCIPESGIELHPDTFILEAGFERLAGIDFRKGCYVGQEVAARMKHKTELRKGLVTVEVQGADMPPGTAITLPDGREAGVIYTRSGTRAIAQLRYDRAAGVALRAGEASVSWTP